MSSVCSLWLLLPPTRSALAYLQGRIALDTSQVSLQQRFAPCPHILHPVACRSFARRAEKKRLFSTLNLVLPVVCFPFLCQAWWASPSCSSPTAQSSPHSRFASTVDATCSSWQLCQDSGLVSCAFHVIRRTYIGWPQRESCVRTLKLPLLITKCIWIQYLEAWF